MDSSTANLISTLTERIDALVASGNFPEALHTANAAVEKSQQMLSTAPEDIDAFASALEIRAKLHRDSGDYEAARDDYRHAIDQLENRDDRLEQLGRLHAGMGAAYDGMDSTEKAFTAWEHAIAHFKKVDPPMDLDIATLSNNLAFLKRDAGDIDGAETYFLQALEIAHKHLGPQHEETASISNNLGALYQISGYYEQAREMHMMALESRRTLLGDAHPDTAQSHNNLALSLMQTGDLAWAGRHFEKATTAYELLGVDYATDLQHVAGNYCDFLRGQGDLALASTIESRVNKTLARMFPQDAQQPATNPA